MIKLINIKSHEQKPFVVLFCMFFSIVATSITGSSVRDTYFLLNFDKSYLPLMYLLTAISMAWIIKGYKRATRNKGQVYITLISNLIFIVPLILLKYSLYGFFIPILYIWIEIITILSIFQFWEISGSVFNSRQAKRLYTFVASGGSFSGIIIGSLIKPFNQSFGSENLLFLTIFFLCLSSLLILLIKPLLSKNKNNNFNASRKATTSVLKDETYIANIAIIVALSALISRIIDYQFKITASNIYPNQENLLNFFGEFYILTGAGTLVMQLIITNYILRRLGILIGIMILPVMIFFGSVGFLLSGTLATIYFAKFSDQVIKFSIHNSIQEILWLPIKNSLKKAMKPFVDGTIRSSVEGLAGISIFLFVYTGLINGAKSNLLSIPVLFGVIFWIFRNFKIKNGYTNSIVKSIEERSFFIDNVKFNLNDSTIIKTIDNALKSKDEFKQLFAIDLLWKQNLKPWKNTLQKLLESSNYKIRRAALELTWNNSEILPNNKIISIMNSDEDLRPFAINCISNRKVNDITSILNIYLDSSILSEKVASATSLLKQNIESKKSIQIIRTIIDDGNQKEKLTLFEFLDGLENLVSDKQISRIFNFESDLLKIKVLKLIEHSPRNNIIKDIIRCLATESIFNQAQLTLKKHNPAKVLENMINVLNSKNSKEQLRIGILRIIYHYDTKKAIHLILKSLEQKQLDITNVATNSLIKISKNYQFDEDFYDKINKHMFSKARDAYRLSQLKNFILEDDKALLVIDKINNELQTITKIMLKLGTIKDKEVPIEKYLHYLDSEDQQFLPDLIELVDSSFTNKNKQLIMPLIDPDVDTLKSLELQFPNESFTFDELILKWINDKDRWKVILGTHYLLKKDNGMLLSKANWKKVKFQNFSDNLFTNSERNYIIRNFYNNKYKQKENNEMYSILEKTMILKSIDLFQQIPVTILTKIGQISEQINFKKGQKIFSMGDKGNSMFVIIKGKVDIVQNSKSIAILDKGSCIGEMAILDNQPRSADALTLSECTLLKIDQSPFYELLELRPEIMKQILRILTKRLRLANRKLMNDQQ